MTYCIGTGDLNTHGLNCGQNDYCTDYKHELKGVIGVCLSGTERPNFKEI